jgi:DnaK suppressor protein
MDADQARQRLLAEQDDVTKLLRDTQTAGREDRESEDETGADIADPAQPLAAEGQDDAIAESLSNRLDQIARALERIDEGTWGRSVRSGKPIPAARLEADPAAELTVEEAAAAEAAER